MDKIDLNDIMRRILESNMEPTNFYSFSITYAIDEHGNLIPMNQNRSVQMPNVQPPSPPSPPQADVIENEKEYLITLQIDDIPENLVEIYPSDHLIEIKTPIWIKSIPLPNAIDIDNIKTTAKSGVLDITATKLRA